MKKVTLTDLSGKEIEVYFADDKTAASAKHSDEYKVNIEDIPSNKNWFDMTGGDLENMNELDVNENSAWCGAETKKNFYQKLDKAWKNKIKGVEQSGSQISIDDTIESDFVKPADQRFGAIYKVSGLKLVAKLADELTTDENKTLLKMKRHGTVFYIEEGTLIKATALEVQNYLDETGVK